MLELLGSAEGVPFAVALGVMLVLAVLQLVGLGHLIGDVDADIDLHVHPHADFDADAGLLSLLGLGRLPFLMWLMLLLSLFGLTGIAAQELLIAFTGTPLSAWLVAPLTALVAMPVTGIIARPLARIMPHDETTAIDLAQLAGREAQVVIGVAAPGSPARARVLDHYGQTHYVMVEPDNPDQRFVEGERVLLVRREGDCFRAISRGDHYLPRLD